MKWELLRWPLVLLLAVVMVAGVGCSDDDDDDGGDVLMPLTMGNEWLLRNTSTLDTTGELDTLLIDVTMEEGGYTWYGDGGDDDSETAWDETAWMRNGSDGLYFRYEDSTGVESGLGLKYPVSAGDSFTSMMPDLSGTMTVVTTDTTVAVEAGSFSGCIHYTMSTMMEMGETSVPAVLDLLAKPGTGLIMQSITIGSGEETLTFSIELLGYTLN